MEWLTTAIRQGISAVAGTWKKDSSFFGPFWSLIHTDLDVSPELISSVQPLELWRDKLLFCSRVCAIITLGNEQVSWTLLGKGFAQEWWEKFRNWSWLIWVLPFPGGGTIRGGALMVGQWAWWRSSLSSSVSVRGKPPVSTGELQRKDGCPSHLFSCHWLLPRIPEAIIWSGEA